MSRSIRSEYPPKRVITLPEEKIVFKPGQGFVIEVPEDEDNSSTES